MYSFVLYGLTIGISILFKQRNYISLTIEEIEEIEKIVVQGTKPKRCCTASLEFLKAALEYLKNLRKFNE